MNKEERKRKYLLPCICSTQHDGGCWFASYDYLEYKKYQKAGLYKLCGECRNYYGCRGR